MNEREIIAINLCQVFFVILSFLLFSLELLYSLLTALVGFPIISCSNDGLNLHFVQLKLQAVQEDTIKSAEILNHKIFDTVSLTK